MQKLCSVVLATIASVGLVQLAAAADLGGGPTRVTVSRTPRSFTSGRFHGAGSILAPMLATAGRMWTADVGPGSHDGDGFLAGAQVGYNMQSGKFVFGLEADMSGAWVDGSTACCGHEFNWLASVRGRAGVAFNGNRTLLYATGGAAWADVDYTAAGSQRLFQHAFRLGRWRRHRAYAHPERERAR